MTFILSKRELQISLHFRGALLMLWDGCYFYILHTVTGSSNLFNQNKGFMLWKCSLDTHREENAHSAHLSKPVLVCIGNHKLLPRRCIEMLKRMRTLSYSFLQ